MEGINRTKHLTKYFLYGLSIIISIYHLWCAAFGFPTAYLHRSLHTLGVFIIFFLGRRLQEDKGPRVQDFLMAVFAIISTGYVALSYRYLSERVPYATALTVTETLCGLVFLIVLIEGARRVAGPVLAFLVGGFLLYGRFGYLLPPPFWHRGFTLNQLIEQIYLTLDGAWGVPLHATSTYVFLFILFGSALVATGAGDFFTDFARALMGRTVGGPAKTAVLSSALMGMLSGSSVANVVTTGAFTIPLMKKEGYGGPFAGAVEAAASTGGQIMPPVMGAAAFIMVEFTGIQYSKIMIHAILPAFLYFLGIFVMVDLESRRLGLKASSPDMLPSLGQTMRDKGYLLIPIGAIVYFLIKGFTPGKAGLWATMLLFALAFIFDENCRKNFVRIILTTLAEAPRMVATVSMACAAAGVIVGVILITGLGARMSGIVLKASGGHLPVALFLVMLTSLVLGMGMPTSGAYIIMAALIAPGLVNMGVPVIVAHMFIFYYACMSALTPPVAVASYAAAGIAESNPIKTAYEGFRLGIAAYIVPFMFVYGQSLLLIGSPINIITTAISSVIGVCVLAVASQNWLFTELGIIRRIGMACAAITLIKPGIVSDLVGLTLAGLIVYIQYVSFKRIEQQSEAVQL